MLYVIHCANHPELTFRGGQEPIVHLQADLRTVEAWAASEGRLWAYSLSNAGAYYVDFDTGLDGLNKIDWEAVTNNDFRDPDVKEGKQSEFLVHESFPWRLITRIGTASQRVKIAAERAIQADAHQPPVEVESDWYF